MNDLAKQREAEHQINMGQENQVRSLPENGTVVYCQFYECVNNVAPPESKTLADFKFGYTPLFDKEAIVRGVCNLETIVLKNPGKVPSAFPDCFVYSNKKDVQSAGWSKNLNQDGTPLGGNIDSQSPEHGNAALA